MESEQTGNVVKLVSKEGESFTLPISIAKMSKLVETTIDDENEDEVQEIPLPNVKSSILSKVIEYCTHYQTVEPMAPITTPLKSSIVVSL
jgi:S-phase kinase-associated protein 1